MKTLILFLMVLSSLTFASEGLLLDAEKTYDSGDYTKSISIYSNAYKQTKNPDVAFNLGTAFFRNGDLGRAIFYFREADDARPRDEEIKFNLSYARDRTVDRFDTSSKMIWDSLSFRSFLSLHEELFCLSLVFLLSSFALYFFVKHRENDWAKISLIILSSILILTTPVVIKDYVFVSQLAVVTAPEVLVKSSIGLDGVTLFKLHAGAELNLLQSYQEWIKIESPDGKRGWVKNSELIY